MATPLEDVGKQVGMSHPLPMAPEGLSRASRRLFLSVSLQVWRGALFLADYILFQWDLFQGRTVLELGAGTGFTSIVAATVAQTVYCTGNTTVSARGEVISSQCILTVKGERASGGRVGCCWFCHPVLWAFPPSLVFSVMLE